MTGSVSAVSVLFAFCSTISAEPSLPPGPPWLAAHSSLAEVFKSEMAPGPEQVALLRSQLQSPHEQNRRLAAEVIGQKRLASLVPELRRTIDDPSAGVRAAGAIALARLDDTPSMTRIRQRVKGGALEQAERAQYTLALFIFNEPAAAAEIDALLQDPQELNRARGLWYVMHKGDPADLQRVLPLLQDETPLADHYLCGSGQDRGFVSTVADAAEAAADRLGLDLTADRAAPRRRLGPAQDSRPADSAGRPPAAGSSRSPLMSGSCDFFPNNTTGDWVYGGHGAQISPDGQHNPMRFYINLNFELPSADELADLLAEAEDWNSVEGSGYTLQFDGYSGTIDVWNSGEVKLAAGTAAGAGGSMEVLYPDGNRYKTGFSIRIHPGSTGFWSFREIAAHELGHALGLGHTTFPGGVMSTATPAETDVQDSGDEDGVRALHPAGDRRPVTILAPGGGTSFEGPSPLTVLISAAGSFDYDGDIAEYMFIPGDGSPPVIQAAPHLTHVYTLPAGTLKQVYVIQGGTCSGDGVDYEMDAYVPVMVNQCLAPPGAGEDCNGNGNKDICDIVYGPVDDCDGDGIPDDCEDCDSNGVNDSCESNRSILLVGAGHPAVGTAIETGGHDVTWVSQLPASANLDPYDIMVLLNNPGIADVSDVDDFVAAGKGLIVFRSASFWGQSSPVSFSHSEYPSFDGTTAVVPDHPVLNGLLEASDLFLQMHEAVTLRSGSEIVIRYNKAHGNSWVPMLVTRAYGAGTAIWINSQANEPGPSLFPGEPFYGEALLRNSVLYASPLDLNLPDCNGNHIPDACEDCDGNGSADSCDIQDGTSDDCDLDQIPDNCELDGDSSLDCNTDGVLDICQPGGSQDCDFDGIVDLCELAAGTAKDCNSNVIPDKCEADADCNNNGRQDICDIACGAGQKCNGLWGSADVNENTVPDECDGCITAADCPCDQDSDGIRDDTCVWCGCDLTPPSATCRTFPVIFGDLGGEFGDCLPDGSRDSSDKFHALNCLSDIDTDGSVGYPCEAAAPFALNVDIGGAYGSCQPDGFCDGNDAFLALNAFADATICTCGGEGPAPVVVGELAFRLVPSLRAASPGDEVAVRVYSIGGVPDLRGFQMHLGTAGGTSGFLELVDIVIDKTEDSVFAGQHPWEAFNLDRNQAVAGLDGPGVAVSGAPLWATFIYKVSPDASGVFTVDLLHSDADPGQRSYLFATGSHEGIAISHAGTAQIRVLP
jgi:hypothetical protein